MNEKKEIYYEFVEPHITGGHATIIISESKILEYMKKVYPNSELSDNELIEEFAIVHWASKVK